jgi:hypothetical protein
MIGGEGGKILASLIKRGGGVKEVVEMMTAPLTWK